MAKRLINTSVREALLANGVDPETLSPEEEARLEGEEPEGEEAEEPEGGEQPEGEDAPADDTPADEPPAVAAAPDAIASLTDRLITATTERTRLEGRVTQLEGDLQTAKQAEDSARQALLVATSRLSVLMNEGTTQLDSMSLSTLAAHYTTLNEKFEKRFPAGAKSRNATLEAPTPINANQGELERRRAALTSARN